MKSGEFFVSTSGFLLWVFGIAGGWCRAKKALEPERSVDALTDIAAIKCSPSDQGTQEQGALTAPGESGRDITMKG